MTNLVFLDNTRTGNWLLLCMTIFFHCVLSILTPRWLDKRTISDIIAM